MSSAVYEDGLFLPVTPSGDARTLEGRRSNELDGRAAGPNRSAVLDASAPRRARFRGPSPADHTTPATRYFGGPGTGELSPAAGRSSSRGRRRIWPQLGPRGEKLHFPRESEASNLN